MHVSSDTNNLKRRPVNLTIREDVMDEAKAIQLNISKAAEAGIISAIKQIQSREWLETNKIAINAHNKRIEEKGVLLKPHWASE